MERWEQMRLKRLTQSDGGGSITFEEFSAKITLLREAYKTDENARQILNRLEAWGMSLLGL